MRGGAVAVAAGQPRPHALLQRLPRLLEGGELPGLAGGVAGGGAGGAVVVHGGLAPHVHLAVHLPQAATLDTHNQQGAVQTQC